MEIRNPEALRDKTLRAVIFDFDGTLSTLRQGWEEVMRSLMLEMIDPAGADAVLKEEVDRFIEDSTGKQTIFQMQWLAQRVRTFGKNHAPLDEWGYKDEYSRRLMLRVSQRLEALQDEGRLRPENFLIAGTETFLKALCAGGLQLYVASGTDHDDVVAEVAALGLSRYFTLIAGAPYRKVDDRRERPFSA